MDRDKIIAEYMSHYNGLAARFKNEKIETLPEEINSAIAKSEMKNVNLVYDKISEWNNIVSNVQGARDAIVAFDKTFRLPVVKEFLIVFDNITKEWRFNTEAD